MARVARAVRVVKVVKFGQAAMGWFLQQLF